jgi:hypothetical protein
MRNTSTEKSMRNMSKNKLFLGNFITKGGYDTQVQKDDEGG